MAGLDSITTLTCDFNWDVCRDTALDRVHKWMCLSDVVNKFFFSGGMAVICSDTESET